MVSDDRVEPPLTGEERAMLLGMLERQRATLAWKCAGLTSVQLGERSVAPSALSLLGLVDHLAAVEESWFQRVLQGAPKLAIWEPDYTGETFALETSTGAVFDRWELECGRSRAFVDSGVSLDHEVEHAGQLFSLRYVLVHMIEEYARHNGHADLLRERIDGSVGE